MKESKQQTDLEQQKQVQVDSKDKILIDSHWKTFCKSLQLTAKYFSANGEIPLYLIDIQLELSQLKDKLNMISAGILTLGDVINLNK